MWEDNANHELDEGRIIDEGGDTDPKITYMLSNMQWNNTPVYLEWEEWSFYCIKDMRL